MNDETTNLDQTDEEILSYTVSDDALEAAARTERGVAQQQGISLIDTSGFCCRK